ncbi:MAG: GAF domain-containing protein, partial [Candidatus Korobacteraceae bacterium]
MVSALSVAPKVEEERYLALLRAANEIATCNDCDTASNSLVKKLREVTPFDYIHIVTFDKETNAACWSLLAVNGERLDPSAQDGYSLAESPFPWVHQSRQPLVTLDWSQSPRFQNYGLFLAKFGIASTCTMPLIRGCRCLGVLSLGRRYPNAYDGEEIQFLG